MRQYAQKIRDLRIDHDLSQAQIAAILGSTKNQVGKYERGEQEMPIKHLLTLCNYYNVSADYILGLPEGRPYGLSKTRK
jgi:transcriptional regulator with XRE-family HTH domain